VNRDALLPGVLERHGPQLLAVHLWVEAIDRATDLTKRVDDLVTLVFGCKRARRIRLSTYIVDGNRLGRSILDIHDTNA
jgi:hypothetical protein